MKQRFAPVLLEGCDQLNMSFREDPILSAARCVGHNPRGPLQAHRRDLAAQSPAVLSTLFVENYAAGERLGVNVTVCGRQSALLANPRPDIQCTAL